MGYAAISLAILGFAVGAVFRLRVLILILALLLFASIVFSLASGFNFLVVVIMGKPHFNLPFRSLDQVLHSTPIFASGKTHTVEGGAS